mmetsp:Transcript_18892/g.47074  ORF Transcript_18892/g.47074 Transcript_18892/m.47074 type:complete len:280 (+) Transcript_18892:1776-2615(+)
MASNSASTLEAEVSGPSSASASSRFVGHRASTRRQVPALLEEPKCARTSAAARASLGAGGAASHRLRCDAMSCLPSAAITASRTNCKWALHSSAAVCAAIAARASFSCCRFVCCSCCCCDWRAAVLPPPFLLSAAGLAAAAAAAAAAAGVMVPMNCAYMPSMECRWSRRYAVCSSSVTVAPLPPLPAVSAAAALRSAASPAVAAVTRATTRSPAVTASCPHALARCSNAMPSRRHRGALAVMRPKVWPSTACVVSAFSAAVNEAIPPPVAAPSSSAAAS